MACSSAPLRERVLAAQIDVAVLAAGRVRGDRHRLDHRERVALEDHPILEGPGLGLVGVADQIVGAPGLAGHRVPFAPGRERGAAAAHELGVEDLADHPLRTEIEGAPQRGVAAVGAIVIKALGVGLPDPAQQTQTGCRRPAAVPPTRGGAGRRAVHDREQTVGVDRGQLALHAARRRTRSPARPAPGRTAPGTGWAASCCRHRSVPAGPICSVSVAISDSEPAQRHTTSSQTCSTRGARGSTENSA